MSSFCNLQPFLQGTNPDLHHDFEFAVSQAASLPPSQIIHSCLQQILQSERSLQASKQSYPLALSSATHLSQHLHEQQQGLQKTQEKILKALQGTRDFFKISSEEKKGLQNLVQTHHQTLQEKNLLHVQQEQLLTDLGQSQQLTKEQSQLIGEQKLLLEEKDQTIADQGQKILQATNRSFIEKNAFSIATWTTITLLSIFSAVCIQPLLFFVVPLPLWLIAQGLYSCISSSVFQEVCTSIQQLKALLSSVWKVFFSLLHLFTNR